MCGIAGFASGGVAASALDGALQQMYHRGPDDYGFLCHRGSQLYLGRDRSRFIHDSRLLLVHRRLSILDLSEEGWQPMQSKSRRYFLTFNGEIYNYIELRKELESLGYHFQSGSDTEVLLEGYAHWGSDVLQKLTGMFSFAVWDKQENCLFLARDFFGIKPLYYTSSQDEFAFASEIPVLLENAKISREANPQRLFEYLRFGATDHGDQTMFRDVRQLPPAHCMTVDLNTLTVSQPVRYWSLPSQPQQVSFHDARDMVRELFLENVRIHLRSDAAIGATLSGGIDSSAIVMAMRNLMPHDTELKLFSFVPDDERISEERWINVVSAASGGVVHKVTGSPTELTEDLRRLTRIHGEPLGSASCVAQYHVFQRAREEGVKVMLDGQGADEMFAGYQTYSGARLASLLRQGKWFAAWKFGRSYSRFTGADFVWLAAQAGDYLLPTRLQKFGRRWLGKEIAPAWLNVDWFRQQGAAPRALKHTRNKQTLLWQLRQSLTDIGLAHLLRYEDRNSMAHSVESRVPFLTPNLAAYATTLPEEHLISPRGESKSVFRAAMRGIVPDEILDRRDKIGFAAPDAKWLTSLRPWVEQMLACPVATAIPAFHSQVLQQYGREVLLEKRPFTTATWRWLSLIEWSRQFQVTYSDAKTEVQTLPLGVEDLAIGTKAA